MSPAFRILVVFALGLALGQVVHAAGPVLAWGPTDSAWGERSLLTGSAANRNGGDLDNLFDTGRNAPRSGSVSLDDPFILGLRHQEKKGGDWHGIDVTVSPGSDRFKSCGEGADPQQDGYESTCRDFTFEGRDAVWIRFHNLKTTTHHGNLIKVDLGSGNQLTIFSTYAGPAGLVTKFQRMFEDFVSTLRIEDGAPPAKRSYHAEIRIPRNLRPGDVISPDVVVIDQDGNRAENIIQEVFFIDGREAGSIRWDGSRTRVTVQVSMKDGQAVTASAVIPAASSPEPEPSQPEPTQVPAPVTEPEPQPLPQPDATGEVPGLGGIGNVPGPRTIGEAVVSILGPAAIGLLGALLGGMAGGGGGAPTPPPPEAPAKPPKTPPKKPRGRGEKPKKKPVDPSDDSKDTKKKKKKSETDEEEKPSEKAEKEKKKKADEKKKEGYAAGLWRRTKGALSSAVEAAKDVATAAMDVANNPGLVIQTGRNAIDDVKQGLESGAPYVDKAIEAAPQIAKAIYKKTLDLVTKPTPELVSLEDLVREAQFRQKIEGIGTGMVQGVLETVKGAATDPDKMADLVKNLTGLEDLEKAAEGNRPLGERLLHGILGALGVVGVAEMAGKVAVKGLRSGASGLAKAAGRKAAGLSDDAIRLAGKATALSDDAARLAGKASGLSDDAARLAGKASGKADDAAKAAAREASEKYIARKAAEIEKKGIMPAEFSGKGDYIDAPNVTPDLRGYTKRSREQLRRLAHEEGKVIYARPSSPHAQKLLDERKAIPKQAWVKNKTANDIDIRLGAPERSEGLAVSFEPRKPPADEMANMSDELANAVNKRFDERAQEWIDQADNLWENADLCTVRNKLIIDKHTGLPYAGDLDIMGVRHVDGSRLSVSEWLRFELKARRMPGTNIAHGSHENWIKAKLGTKKRVSDDLIDRGVRGKHALSSGKEALVTFRPGHSKPSASWLADHASKVGP